MLHALVSDPETEALLDFLAHAVEEGEHFILDIEDAEDAEPVEISLANDLIVMVEEPQIVVLFCATQAEIDRVGDEIAELRER